ncbi:ABC transporter ATP-binding protein [Quadrisphaera sp. KR29]|uniref:ABC transporter ATP-binding protein n=1 Tax=Quadrisphaera sp. KR29 TaxID=3461391 RepID=UPI004044FC1A
MPAPSAQPVPAAAPAAPPPGASPSPAVWCSHLRKAFRRHQAVHDVSLQVGRGEVVGLLGPNGAGKTTVIKMLLGLATPDAGEVLLLGRPVDDPAARAGVGYLPELFRYQPWLSAAEVLALHVRLSGADVSAAEQRERLELVGLGARAADRVGGFSKGMQQRLGLAVALVARPRFVVLDEPTSALDPLGRADVRDVVLGLREQGVAVLLNSHLIGEVERVCDRVVVLERGRVAASGTLAELLGQRQVRLRLTGLGPEAERRLAAAGAVHRGGDGPDVLTLSLAEQDDAGAERAVPALVRDLAALGVDVHAVEPVRVSLEDRLLGILRGAAQEREQQAHAQEEHARAEHARRGRRGRAGGRR